MKRVLTALLAGLLFGAGLCLSGMTWPSRVVGFLDVAGDWDPSLGFVMVGAVGTYAIAYALTRPAVRPAVSTSIDARLIAGAALFGTGWGLSGWCPGPVIVSLAALGPRTFVFVGAVIVGMVATRLTDARRGAR